MSLRDSCVSGIAQKVKGKVLLRIKGEVGRKLCDMYVFYCFVSLLGSRVSCPHASMSHEASCEVPEIVIQAREDPHGGEGSGSSSSGMTRWVKKVPWFVNFW